jgi:hypothetical protein
MVSDLKALSIYQHAFHAAKTLLTVVRISERELQYDALNVQECS